MSDSTNTNNINLLKADLAKKAQEEAEASKDFFSDDKAELTDKEKEILAQVKSGNTVVVQEEDDEGNSKEVPLDEYMQSLDSRKMDIMNATGVTKVMKAINNGDIKEDVAAIKERAKQQALAAFHSMSVSKDQAMTDEDYLAVNDRTLQALMEYYHVSRVSSDVVMKDLSKKSLRQICEIIPKEFVDLYVDPAELAVNNVRAKERLLATISYLCVTGPELDYLNDYIDDENKAMQVAQRLLQCEVDFTEALKDERNWADILKEAQAISPIDTSFWTKYIREPNRVHNEFAQKAVLHSKYIDGYTKILDEYPVISLAEYADKPDELANAAKEAARNERARQQINAQIEESQKKSEIYKSIVDLKLMKELWDILWRRLQINKKTTYKSLTIEAVNAIERVRRAKINLNFPGYQGTEKKAEQIFEHYMTEYPKMILQYNATIRSIREKEPDSVTDIETISVDGYEPLAVAQMFSMLLCILMGRVEKKLDTHDSTKYDAIELDSYFTLFCRLGLDIYLMNDVWLMMKDFVAYSLSNYVPVPTKSKGGKK